MTGSASETYQVTEQLAGKRADAVVAALCETSRSEAAGWIAAGRVTWAQDRTQRHSQADDRADDEGVCDVEDRELGNRNHIHHMPLAELFEPPVDQ